MTDDNENPNSQNLTPAQPVAPRRKLPANPRMAQPMGRPVAAAPEQSPATEPAAARAVAPAPAPLEQLALDQEPTEVAEPAPVVETFSPVQPVVERVAPAPVPVPVAAPIVEPAAPAQPEFDFPKTIRDTLRKVDETFAMFRSAAGRFPSERMDERIGPDGWTHKQMLEHVAAWHDLTADRVIKMINTGASVPLDKDTDSFNAAVARQAVGKTSGEVLKDIDATFNRLRRQLARVTDDQLRNDDWWLAWVVGGNTYGHYEEHWADIYTPELASNGRQRR